MRRIFYVVVVLLLAGMNPGVTLSADAEYARWRLERAEQIFRGQLEAGVIDRATYERRMRMLERQLDTRRTTVHRHAPQRTVRRARRSPLDPDLYPELYAPHAPMRGPRAPYYRPPRGGGSGISIGIGSAGPFDEF